MRIILVALILGTVAVASARTRHAPKTQEVDFDTADINGTVHNPDGAYVLQKRAVKFIPLYKVRQQFDDSIKQSIEYVR